LRFQLAAHNFKNASEYPPNAAYYQFGPSGVANLTACSQGRDNIPFHIFF
jgi:hypothetical protein